MTPEARREIQRNLTEIRTRIVRNLNFKKSKDPLEVLEDRVKQLKVFADKFNKEATPIVNSISEKYDIEDNKRNASIIEGIVQDNVEQASAAIMNIK